MDPERTSAYLALKKIEDEGCWSNLAVSEVLGENAASAAFVRELVYGVLRNRILIDHNIGRYLRKPSLNTEEKILLRMGFYQLCFMDSVTDYAAVNETVALARSFAKGREGFVNAVLRSFLRDGKKLVYPEISSESTNKDVVNHLRIKYSCSPWIIKLWLLNYGREKTEEMLEASLCRPPLAIRANRMKISRSDLKERLIGLGFEAEEGSLSDHSLICSGAGLLSTDLFKNGYFSVQGEASQLAARLVNASEGETVLDLCAAPGGKSCAMAEAMNGKGRVVSFELYEQRTALIKASAKRLGLEECIKTVCADTSQFMPQYSETADAVLCDVPCSGLGVIRQKPEIKLSARPEDLEKLYETQYRILENGSKYVKRGGRLVYSTCTVNPDENTNIINLFLEKNPEFSPEYEKQFFVSRGGADGFYICLMRRSSC